MLVIFHKSLEDMITIKYCKKLVSLEEKTIVIPNGIE